MEKLDAVETNLAGSGRTRTTIRDVAREAGVATSTVSRIISGSANFSAATVERVTDAARRLSYYPSATAQGLRSSRTMTLGVLVPDLGNMLFADYLRGAERAALEHGYSVFICEARGSAELERMHLTRLFQHRVDGLLLGATVQADDLLGVFVSAGIPVEPRRSEEVPRTDLEARASIEAFRRLIALGHRQFAFFIRSQGVETLRSARWRLLSSELEAVEAGLKPRMIEVESVEQCVEAILELEKLAYPPTAYISSTHLLAPIVLESVREAGLRIPEDVSVLAYGDSAWASAYRPSLSVVKHDYAAEAAAYIERLVARIEGRGHIPPPPIVPSHFLERGSCGPAPVRPRVQARGASPARPR